MTHRIPASPQDITPKWLTSAFRSTGLLVSESVTQVTAQVIGADRGFTGVVARLSLQYSSNGRADLPSTVIVKMPHAARTVSSAYQLQQSTSPAALRHMLQRGLHELAFYNDLVPASHGAAPARLFAASDPESLHSILILEDLATATPGDVLSGCSPADAVLVVRAIAALHAQWWQHPALASQSWLSPPTVDPKARRDRYAAALPEFLGRHSSRLPASFLALLTALEPTIPALLAHVERAPRTLIHADLHLDNIIFTPERLAAPVHILDWQSVSLGPAARDIATFLAGSLSPHDQASATAQLLDAYHAALASGGVVDYERLQLQQDYRLSLLLVIVSVVIWLGSVDLNTLAGRERAIVEAAIGDGRLIAAAESQNLMSAIPAM